MEFSTRNQSVSELRAVNRKLTLSIVLLAVGLLLALLKLAFQSEIVVMQTPGMPDNAVIEKTALDKGTQKATLTALTAAIAQINPANATYQKEFVQAFLSPTAFTKVSREIDAQVARLTSQRELGSYYFVLHAYEYDPSLDRHFVTGEVHTVNAAHDTAEAYVFEYAVHVENYRMVVDDVTTYPGDKAHDSEWKQANKK